jgi:hypothetical protein
MTDRHSGYVVALDRNMREDDAQAVLDAIQMVKGVISVRPVVADPLAEIHAVRVRRELLMKMYDVLENDKG